MKRIVFIYFVFTSVLSYAEVTPIKVKSTIENVTVFLTGGEIQRSTSTNLKKGRNKIVFTGISTVIDDKSIQFSSTKSLNLVSVSSEIDYIHRTDENSRITTLKDSVELLQDQIVDLRNEKSAYLSEKQLLEKNTSIKGEQQNLSVEELKAMAIYFRERMTEINKKNTYYDLKIRTLNNLITRYNSQLNELNYKALVKSNQVIIIVDSEIDQKADLNLKYIVSNCGWQANYDLLANNLQEQITLKYKAKVYNNTGNDWTDVALFLSTSDPNLSASAPNLAPWFLDYQSLKNGASDDYDGKAYVVPQNRGYKKFYQNANAPGILQNLDGVGFYDNNQTSNPQDLEANLKFTNIEVSQLSRTFKIEKSYSIPSDSKPYIVEITTHNLNASFSHKAVPKLDQDAFLLANIVGWESLDLVPGPTQVYFSNAFVGQSYINTSNVSDTLRLSLGRDLKVPVFRNLVKENSDKKVVGGNRKDTYTYKLVAKNNRSIPVKLKMFDQIPISRDSDISVTVNETNGAKYNETTGRLDWLLALSPGESKTYQISFTLKYPKDRTIRVKKYRTISAPSF